MKTVEEIIKEVKALRKKLEEMEEGTGTKDLQDRIDRLENALDKDPNFGSWD